MDDLMRRQVHRLLDEVAPPVTVTEVRSRVSGARPVAHRRPPATLARRTPVLAAVAAIVVLAAFAALTVGSRGRQSVPLDVGGARPTGHWQALPPGPLPPRRDATLVSAGSSVVVLGGAATDGTAFDGRVAAFDLITGTWRSLPDLPLPLGRRPAAAVLGDAVYALAMNGPIAFMRYDLSDERWTLLEWSWPMTTEHHLTPYGDGLVLWGPSDPSLRLYEPSTGAWRDLPADPLTALNDRAVVVTPAGLVVVARAGSDPYQAALFAGGTWSSLPAAPGGGASRTWFATVAGALGVDRAGGLVTLDPSSGLWTERAAPSSAAGWSGIPPVSDGRWIATDGWVLNPMTNRPDALTAPEDGPASGAAAAWIGGHLVVWGGARGEDHDGRLVDGGWQWSVEADAGESAVGPVPGTSVPGTVVPGTVPAAVPEPATGDHAPANGSPGVTGATGGPAVVSGDFRGTDSYVLEGRGCEQLRHTVGLDLMVDGEVQWRYNADVCGVIDADNVWSGTGQFEVSAPDGIFTGTVHSRAQLPSTGEPYRLEVTSGVGRFAGATGSCVVDNHLRETRIGLQDQWGTFTCDLTFAGR